MLGETGHHNVHAVQWEKDFTSAEVDVLSPGLLAGFATIAIQNPVKAASIKKLRSMQVIPQEDAALGLTPETLKLKIASFIESSSAGQRIAPKVGIRMSAEDVKIGGKDLIRKVPGF